MRRGYRRGRVLRRIARAARTSLWGCLNNAIANAYYVGHQHSLSQTGLERIRVRGPWPGPGDASFRRGDDHPDGPAVALEGRSDAVSEAGDLLPAI